jgi:hypothetical protein
MSIQLVEHELGRLESLWDDGLSDAYHAYLDPAAAFGPDVQPRLALAAALVEVGLRLQGLGDRAAAAPTLLMGDLCLARSARLLADAAPQSVQIAFSRAIESLSSAAASGAATPSGHTRELLTRAFEAK